MLIPFLLAALPIFWLIFALCALKMAAYKACFITMLITWLLALFYKGLGLFASATAVLEGLLYALWPICLVIAAALFTYNLTLRTGAMDKIKSMLGRVSPDSRIQMLIIGWGFGNFLEGMAGFGTAVAIPASMLAALSLDPVNAVLACLVGNATPTAFGSVGVPTVTLSNVTELSALTLSHDIVLLQALLTFISPFLMVCLCGRGIKALKGMLPLTLLSSLAFLVPWILCASLLGPELPNIIGSVLSMALTIAAAKKLAPRHNEDYVLRGMEDRGAPPDKKEAVKAWAPFIFIFVFLLLSSKLCPPICDLLSAVKTGVSVYAGEGAATLTFGWINTPGIMIFLAAFLGGRLQGASMKLMLAVLKDTVYGYWKTFLTICSVLAAAKLLGYSGMVSDIALFLVTITGPAYPLVAPLIGVLGGFLTGSGTSTAVLFGGLQVKTALLLGLDPSLIASSNMMGAGIGKMIAPQNLAIGSSAIGLMGQESRILKKSIWFALLYLVLSGILCFVFSRFPV